MCYGCWEELGKPLIRNERVVAAVPLIAAVYGESCVGGNLHIVLDDWNIGDDNVAWCLAEENHTNPLTDAERACCEAMAAMSEAERASSLAIHDGFVDA